jgi:uncharacterized glyoxalase superfamily protein PhnB
MANAVSPIPEGMHTVTPHLVVNGAAEYIDFLKRAFGAEEVMRAPVEGGKLMHATVRIGDSALMLNDHFPEFGGAPIAQGYWPIAFHLYVPDADAAFSRATAAGCTVFMPIADQFWGDRYGQLQDPYGFRWAVATRKEIVQPEEAKRRQQELFGKGQSAS